ncbi:MAG: hypothetical protein A2X56_06395 [Nitrospirae bacterium GWC2_57_13]|nr:MAG: hypothetical protein A2X56_06395 [Nitrospirae bacterium GWC2_57_13]OGW45521.1 MAG: hypothetical protein A2X57_09360 [Nitrospirae bacterium GWD2_57_8]
MSSKVKIAALVLLATALFLSPFFWDMRAVFSVDQMKQWLEGAGPLAPLLYMAAMAIAVIVSPIPSVPLDIAAGAFFGPFLGTVYSVIGALAGAGAAFLIARFLGREFMERHLGGHINFCSACSNKLLTRIVFLSRLIPVVSFDVVSYGAGLTKMSLSRFSLATFFGLIPLTFAYNYFGSALIVRSRLAIVLGIVMVVLFFLIPKWLERKGFEHKNNAAGAKNVKGEE